MSKCNSIIHSFHIIVIILASKLFKLHYESFISSSIFDICYSLTCQNTYLKERQREIRDLLLSRVDTREDQTIPQLPWIDPSLSMMGSPGGRPPNDVVIQWQVIIKCNSLGAVTFKGHVICNVHWRWNLNWIQKQQQQWKAHRKAKTM